MGLLHVHEHTGGEGILLFLDEVLLHALIDTLKLLPFLFLTYLLMEFIEHKAQDKAERFVARAGAFAPSVGALVGAVPQCGFSAAASNLYAGRVISLGTLVAVFLSTSDEMIPILISGDIDVGILALIVLYKILASMAVGFGVDIFLRAIKHKREDINIDEICEKDECHCERGIFYSALHHTVTISVFVLVATVAINALVFFIGDEALGASLGSIPGISHIAAALIGLIPNCAPSVLLATLYKESIISIGTMLSGLFSGAGVGLLVLFKVNKNVKENVLILVFLVVCGAALGLLGELLLAF